MSFKHRLYLIAFVVAFLLLSFVYFDSAEASISRERYTLIDKRATFLFSNHAELPFQLIREMCWNATEGFCDVTGDADELYILIDWQENRFGSVYQDESGGCFWWMFQPVYGDDNNPHIMEHYWIECSVFEIASN